MESNCIMEPGLTQAVRIVLKYEIKSLLSRLSDTGEEYIVITASMDDRTCGHIGSVKGEGFVQKSNIQTVKQQFLNFCTGDERKNKSSSRRKSTPRHKIQSWSQSRFQHHENESSIISQSADSADVSCALDLSDKTNSRYLYTLDNPHLTNDNISYDNISSCENDADDLGKSDLNENFHKATCISLESELILDEDKESCADYTKNNKSYHQILDAMSGPRESRSFYSGTIPNKHMQQDLHRKCNNRRLSRITVPVKIEPEPEMPDLPKQNTCDVKFPSFEEISTDHKPYIESSKSVLNSKSDSRCHLKEQKNNVDFADMRSVFEDIGSMNEDNASCAVYIQKDKSDNQFVDAKLESRDSRGFYRELPETTHKQHGLLNKSTNRRKARKTVPVKLEPESAMPDIKFPSLEEFPVDRKPLKSVLSCVLGSKTGSRCRLKEQKSSIDFADMKSAFEEIGNMAKCLICHKILANKNNRTFHWRSHVGDKRYTCDICNKAFTHPSNMRSHRKIHTDEKPFPCELCDRRFRRRDYLLQHLERFHYNPKSSEAGVSDNAEVGMSDNIQVGVLDNVGTENAATDSLCGIYSSVIPLNEVM